MSDDPIDRKRTSSGSIDIGSPDEAILSLKAVGSKLFVIKESSIYEVVQADDIDPQRTNIAVPRMVHKLLVPGSVNSEIVSRIFLTAMMFFKKESITDKTLLDKIWNLVIELTQESLALKKSIDEYHLKEKDESDKYNLARRSNRHPTLPSIPDLDTSLKTIFQKTHHISQVLVELSLLMLNKKADKQAHFSTLQKLVEDDYGKDDFFAKFLAENAELMLVIREIRNGLDHRLPTVVVQDFKFNPDTSIYTPTIKLKARGTILDELPVSEFLNQVETIFSLVEISICHLANVTVRRNGEVIKEIPPETRRYPYVRCCFYIQALKFYTQS